MVNQREKIIKYTRKQIKMVAVHEHGSLQIYNFTKGQDIIPFVERQESCLDWFEINVANNSIIQDINFIYQILRSCTPAEGTIAQFT